ncbi:MAG: hypothetical protein ACJARX_000061 [Psychroserpens sp.]|jgi:hypothetical protein|uniref:hypothetical protein n=1 Tax=Psychroserpens sp. TaxID=2020870 RepID=UPI0039E6071B
MKPVKRLFVNLFFLGFIFLTSCVNDIDFDQTEDILPRPTLESSLVFSSLNAPRFIDDTTQQEILVLTDTTRLEFINSDFFVDQLAKTNLTFRFANSLDRSFNIDLIFVNDSNEQRYLVQVEVLAGQPASPTLIASNFLIQEPELSLFKEATKLIYIISLPETINPIEISDLGVLKLESKATFYFEL